MSYAEVIDDFERMNEMSEQSNAVEREAFEDLLKRRYHGSDYYLRTYGPLADAYSRNPEDYYFASTEREFEVWQACAARKDAKIAQLRAKLAAYESRDQEQLAGVSLKDARSNRVYLAGPMTGIDEYNFPAFNAEADRLRALGLHVENPADHGIVEGADWADYLRYDIERLATCERIHLLPGWAASRGAKLEVSIAQALGMQILYAEGAAAAPARIVMPDYSNERGSDGELTYEAKSRNAALDEVARLNAEQQEGGE